MKAEYKEISVAARRRASADITVVADRSKLPVAKSTQQGPRKLPKAACTMLSQALRAFSACLCVAVSVRVLDHIRPRL